MKTSEMQATESHGVDQALARLPETTAWVTQLIGRIKPYVKFSAGVRVLDVGAAQGAILVAFEQAGFEALGVEPWEAAQRTSSEVARYTGCDFEVVAGRAEALPFDDESFDLVHASSVIEHVDDVDLAYREAHRVLRPGGAFYFNTTSAVCPRQSEIARFPLFPWYPGPAKLAIMRWAVRERPSLVGFTEKPAYYWPTPRSARKQLLAAGFTRTYNRWELLRSDDKPGWRGAIIQAACDNAAVRSAGDLILEGLACLALKEKGSANASL